MKERYTGKAVICADCKHRLKANMLLEKKKAGKNTILAMCQSCGSIDLVARIKFTEENQ